MTKRPIAEIRFDLPTARGGKLHGDWIAVLATIPDLEPITVTPAGQLLDGRHRLEAARRRGFSEIEVVEVSVSNELEALEFSAKVNAHRALPLTASERSSLALELLNWAPDWSDRRIAELAGVSPTTVGAKRRQAGVQIGHRVGRDGRMYPSPEGRPALSASLGSVTADRRLPTVLALLRKAVRRLLGLLRRGLSLGRR